MNKTLWIAAAMISLGGTVIAQPTTQNETTTTSDSTSIAELERAIGGRTTLELKFKGATAEELTEAIEKSSGLKFGPLMTSPFGVRNIGTNLQNEGNSPAEVPRWDADVAKTDFWLALRNWNRAENIRLSKLRDELNQLQKEEWAKYSPNPAQGETLTPEQTQEQQAQLRQLQMRQQNQLELLSNHTLTATSRFDTNRTGWNLLPSDELVLGRAINVWPCLLVVSKFQRAQNFDVAEADTKSPDGTGVFNPRQFVDQPERLEGGFLSDKLTLDLGLYVDPKIKSKAKVDLRVEEARDDAGEDLLRDPENQSLYVASRETSPSSVGIFKQVQLLPRQAKGEKLAVLRGVVSIRYPMKAQTHEITDFSAQQPFTLNTTDLPIEAQFQPPHVEDGYMVFSAKTELNSKRGGRRLFEETEWRPHPTPPQVINHLRNARNAAFDTTFQVPSPILSDYLLNGSYTFTDTEGRLWKGGVGSHRLMLRGPDGRDVPVTSPPTPLPDDFTYYEEQSGRLALLPPAGSLNSILNDSLSPEELAQVRFVKATFTTDYDWRTIEIPFEFRDLPLPPR